MTQIRADFLLMENHLSVYNLTDTLIQNGYRNLAFAGEPGHCRSFNERYQGFMHALSDNMLTPAASQFTGRTVFDSPQDLEEAISRTMQLPDVFVCANDFVAIDLIHALKNAESGYPRTSSSPDLITPLNQGSSIPTLLLWTSPAPRWAISQRICCSPVSRSRIRRTASCTSGPR